MFRMWCRLFSENGKLIDDKVIENSTDDNRTKKIFNGLTQVCKDFDLPEPIWLESNIKEFKSLSRTRFLKDNFIEGVPFEYMEIQVIEED